MKILMLSTDKKIFQAGGAVAKRMLDYSSLFEELHIIVYTQKQEKFTSIKLSDNVFVYGTNSLAKIFYFWDGYGIAERILKNPGEWVITSQDPFLTGSLGYLLRLQFRQAPLQIQIHTDFLSREFWRESFKNKIFVLLGKFLLKKADLIRVVSLRIKNSIINSRLKIKASNIQVVPVFVDIDEIKNAESAINIGKKYSRYDFIILMASRLSAEKNISLAIESLLEVIKYYPKTLLLIVGDGPEVNNLKLKILYFKIQNNAKIEPWTNDIASYYKAADLFLLTSNYEGYGRTVIEVMAAGLPVIMTDVGLAGEILIDGENGKVIPVGDKEQLVSAITVLIENKSLCLKFKSAALKRIASLPSLDAYLNIYKKAFEL